MKKQLIFLIILLLLPLNVIFAEDLIPKITSITPTKIQLGDEIEITGVNFGNEQTYGWSISDKRDNTNQEVIEWSSTKIKTKIGNIHLGTNSLCIDYAQGTLKCFEDVPFDICSTENCAEISPPKIFSVSPTTVRIGDTLEVVGENFENMTNKAQMEFIPSFYYSSAIGQVISWSNTKILVKVSSGVRLGLNDVSNVYYDNMGRPSSFSSPEFTVKDVCKSGDNWSCSDYGVCSESGIQIRTCAKTSECQFLNSPMPALTQTCNYIPSCTANDYSCGNWSACSQNGRQTRACDKIKNCQDGAVSIATSQSCTYTPACISFYYSSWSECSQDGKQTRNITSKYPSDCEGGVSPQTTQSCTPPCTSDIWSCSDWNSCSAYGTQTRTCTKTFDCLTVYTPSPTISQSCTPPCNADTWTCGTWSSCSLSGIQNRSCTKTFDCPNVQTTPPITDQYCEPPNRSIPQTPPSGTDEILNQDSIIKSSVKLLCPVDAQRASQGSGTVIDPSGIILTNKHVIAGTLGCLVGFINDFNDEPYFGERQIADIFKVSSNQDIAILKIRNPQNRQLTSIDITRGNSNLRLGTKITIYGYPAKFGTNITYTSGDFSGTDGNYLKTTAILEYGNSGGGAYLKDGTFIGIPSAVVKGELNALGYILSINTINSWLGNSSITYGGTSNNTYSRVSVLEDIDLNKLDSLKLFIPETDVSGNLVAPVTPATNQKTQKITEQSQSSQAQEESTVIKSADTNQKTNLEQNNSIPSEKGNNHGIKVPEQRRSIVANAVQEIVKVAERNGGVGKEIKVIAQTQTQNQEKLEIGIQKIQGRSGFAKFFIGPNYNEIKNSYKLLEQSKKQIQELYQLRTQVVNQGDQLQIVEQIQLLEQANQQIETSLNEAPKGFSLFGWIFRLFTK